MVSAGHLFEVHSALKTTLLVCNDTDRFFEKKLLM